MRKRPATLDTVRVALELLRRIPRGHFISAPELRAQLEEAGHRRDLRTVQRLLEMLTTHYDIERDDRSRPYGYRWKVKARGFSLPALTEHDSLLLTLAEQHLRNLLPAPVLKSMSGFFQQARINIGPHATRRLEREWLSKVRVVSETQPLLPPTMKSGILEQVSTALYANRWLEVEYRNASGKRIEAEVMPLGLAQQGARLYLVCRFAGFCNERSIAVHRIARALATIRTFARPAEFDLSHYDEDGRFSFGEGERITLTFRIDKAAGQHLLETPLSSDQSVVEREAEYEITATVVESAVLWRWLRGFGDAVSYYEDQ